MGAEYSAEEQAILDDRQNNKVNENNYKMVATFKDFKGFKLVEDIEKKYKLLNVLGQGAQGQVRRAKHKDAKIYCAIKIIDKKSVQQDYVKDLLKKELTILEEITHPLIMRIYELREDENFVYIVSEYCENGSLWNCFLELATAKKKMPGEDDVKKIVRQILLALNYMHKKNIVHRDIKLENILVESKTNWEIKLTDFGMASHYNEADKLESPRLGSPLYMAPEIIQRCKYDSKCDIWSTGVTAYILLSAGEMPFLGRTKEELFENIKNKPLEFEESKWTHVSE